MAKLWVRYGSMSASKSLNLLAARHNYMEQDATVALFTAAIDGRYGHGKVTSRIGLSADAQTFDESTVFNRELAGDVACLMVDEAQFLTPEQVVQLHRLAHQQGGIPVMCFCLRTDFRGMPFPGSAMLMCLGDDLSEVRTICKCRRKASMNIRVREDDSRVVEGEQIEIGGNARYKARCPRCFYDGE